MSADLQHPSGDETTRGSAEERSQASDRVPVALDGVAETLLIPIAARAMDATSSSPLLGDNQAAQVMRRLDYDFDRVRFTPSESQSIAIRTLNFDRFVSSFLERHPAAVVVQLGCGLDSRAQRLAWGKEVTWIDVDLPEVVELRRQVMPTTLPGRDYRLVGADVTAKGWLEGLPSPRPTAVVMEGFLSYFSEEDSRALLRQLVDYFAQGELFLECMTSALVAQLQQGKLQAYRKTGVAYKSAVDDVKQFEKIKEGVRVVETIRFFEAPGVEKLPWLPRLRMYIASWIPSTRDSVRLVRLSFGCADP